MRDYKQLHDYDSRHFRFPRSRREAGLHRWQEEDDNMAWPAIVLWAIVGAVFLWLFFTLVLSI